MQTAKEFLDEEQQTILATQTDANEYLLSRLNQAISRIRDDFDQLNKTQLKQMENQYQQLMQITEENLLNKSQPDLSAISQQEQHVRQIEYEQESIGEELTVLNDYHQSHSERILFMVSSDVLLFWSFTNSFCSRKRIYMRCEMNVEEI
jgi:hypothetical protein